MEFTVGIFARLGERWDPDKTKYVPEVQYVVSDYVTEGAIEAHRKGGLVLVRLHPIPFDPLLEGVPYETLVSSTVEGIREAQTAIRAEAESACTKLQTRINDLLMLAAPSEASDDNA